MKRPVRWLGDRDVDWWQIAAQVLYVAIVTFLVSALLMSTSP